jgi:twinkle protein
MAQVITSNIDFSAYMEETDHEHKVIRAGAYADDVVAYYHSQSAMIGEVMPWPKTYGQVRFRPGEVTLWAGMNGHGKSLVLGQLSLAFIAQQKKVCIASMEMKPMITLARICRQADGCSVPSVEFIREFHEVTDGWMWLYDQQGTVRPEMMLAVVRYCADRLKVSHFILDSLMKCGIGEDDYNRQKWFIDCLTSIARDTGIHIHLVAHSRKAKDEMAPPGKMDVKGTGSITDQVDNVMTVWRNKKKEADLQEKKHDSLQDPDALIICDKQRNGEWEGKIKLWFAPESMQFVENGVTERMNLLAPIGNGSANGQ